MISGASVSVDSSAFRAGLARLEARMDAATAAALKASAEIVQRGFLARSQGRPGPNRITGRHQGSWQVEGPRSLGVGRWMIEAGPTAPYSRRLEIGYRGSAVYPSVGPALEWASSGPIMAAFIEEWRRGLG